MHCDNYRKHAHTKVGGLRMLLSMAGFPQGASVNNSAWPRQAVLKERIEQPGQTQGSMEPYNGLLREKGRLSNLMM